MPVFDGSIADPSRVLAVVPDPVPPTGAWHQRVPDGETLRAGRPDDAALLVWPSQVWRAHLAECGLPRRKCSHDIPLPEWWMARLGRAQMPLHSDPAEAVRLAMGICNRYRGTKAASTEGVEFSVDAVRDALPVAPQPVSKEWVRSSLATIANLATWVHDEGEPLTRRHVFDSHTVHRWLHGPTAATDLTERTRQTYRARIDRVAILLLDTPRLTLPAPSPDPSARTLPLTRQEESDVWAWSQGIRPLSRRTPVQAYICLGLGFGTHRREGIRVRGTDITRDRHGVHLRLPKTTSGAGHVPARVVTCRADWEDRTWALREAMDRQNNLGNLFTFPHMSRDLLPTRMDNAMSLAQTNPAAPPPRRFSSEAMRNTWILRHLEAGTPLHLLMERGGLLSHAAFAELVPYMEPVSGPPAAALLRATGGYLA